MRPPPGYDAVELGTARALAVPEASDWAGEVLTQGGTLYDWAASREHAKVFAGRGDVLAVPSPSDGDHWWVFRHYRRGGMAARLLDDRYVSRGPARPWVELRASLAARDRGIDTPRIVAGAVYPEGRLYRADLVTEFVADGVNLAEAVFGPTEAEERRRALKLAGSLLRRLEDAAILHVDFNASNILIRGTPVATAACVLDLDRAQVFDPGEPFPRGVMRRRLERSLRKFEKAKGRVLEHRDWAALRAGYESRS